MKTNKITFIGGGNMAEALLAGLIKAGHDAANIIVTDTDQTKLDSLASQYGVQTSSDNAAAVAHSDVIVLAVKPQVLESVLSEVGSVIPQRTTVVSIAAGVGIQKLKDAANRDDLSIVRVMPNTPAMLGAGMSVLFSSEAQQHKDSAEYILAASGEVAWVDSEKDLHAVTAVSGSGPAYFFLLAEAMQAAGESMGLSKELAAKLANQTALGAGRMLAESGRDAATLRAQVTSKGGT
ncbi:MAG: pyrroline-5-carboxylate reductase, partial [Ghiorsea sp.]|nr:pyrroline-5-carboxylate reductase [Ghiorsea sp.]